MATIPSGFTILFSVCDVNDCYTRCYCISPIGVYKNVLQRYVTIMLQVYLCNFSVEIKIFARKNDK